MRVQSSQRDVVAAVKNHHADRLRDNAQHDSWRNSIHTAQLSTCLGRTYPAQVQLLNHVTTNMQGLRVWVCWLRWVLERAVLSISVAGLLQPARVMWLLQTHAPDALSCLFVACPYALQEMPTPCRKCLQSCLHGCKAAGSQQSCPHVAHGWQHTSIVLGPAIHCAGRIDVAQGACLLRTGTSSGVCKALAAATPTAAATAGVSGV